MRKINNLSSHFDDDFEVSYEEEIPFTYTLDHTDAHDFETEFLDIYEEIEESIPAHPKKQRISKQPRNIPKKKASKKSPLTLSAESSSVAKKSSSYGTKSIYRAAHIVVRIISVLIGLGTLGTLAYNFWRGSAPYGDPTQIPTEENLTLMSYTIVAFTVLFLQSIAFFWSLTKLKIRDGRKVYREDTGRGLTSFVILYLFSYLSFLLNSIIPERFEGLELLNGILGGLDVFGSMHNTLLGLGIAGVTFCIIRKKMNPL